MLHETSLRSRLRLLRESRGLSRELAAAAIGATGGQWGNWERGVSRPSIDELAAICRAYRVTFDWLLGLAGQDSDAPFEATPTLSPERHAAIKAAALKVMGVTDAA